MQSYEKDNIVVNEWLQKKLSPPGEVALSATVYRSNASGARIKLNKETKNVSRYA